MNPTDLLIADLADEFGKTPWFAAIGAKPQESDRKLAVDYFAKIGLKMVAVWLHDLGAAEALLQRGEIDEAWSAAERAAEARLRAAAAAAFGERVANDALNRSALAASDAAMAAARAHFTKHQRGDEALLRVAAGSASGAAAQYALVHLAGADTAAHPFAAKFRFYGAGRWPLIAVDEQFALL